MSFFAESYHYAKGERIVGDVVGGISNIVILPFLVVGVIIAAPVYGLIHSVGAIDNLVRCSMHNKKMKNDWKYRLNHQAIRMSALKIWQRDINAYDQHMRKMLAIAELNDIPLEVWWDLFEIMNERIYELAQMFGIPELYTSDIKKEAVEIAMSHYRRLYQELYIIPEAKEAELIVTDIIASELFGRM
jgi:hypothetical protein